MGFFCCFKKLISVKRNRASFAMPYEINNPNPTSESPRCSVNQLRSSVMNVPGPALCITRPTLRRRMTYYRVHSYGGRGSPPSGHQSSVRFSHPVVNNMARLSATSSNVTAGGGHSRSRSNSATTQESTSSFDLTALDNMNDAKPLRPQEIWRFINQSVSKNGVHETYSEFKNRLDGHASRTDVNRVSAHAPSLNCITRVPTMKLDDRVFQSTQSETTDDIQKHRDDTLHNLEGTWLPKNTDRYVLATMPNNDLPITAVSSQQHPASLLPGNGKYQAYNPASQDNRRPRRDEEISLPPTPDMTKEEFHKRHSDHYKRVESGVFDDVMPNNVSKSPMSEEEFNKRHSDHYKHVESGIFDKDVLNTTIHPFPIPFALHPANSTTSFLLPPTPSSASSTSKSNYPHTNMKEAHQPAGRTSLDSKPLPPIPILKTKTKPKPISKILSPVPMNTDRYPFIFKNSSKHFSAEPQYQARFINDVEAKYRAGEKLKADKKAKQESKSHRKMTGSELRVLTEMQELDSQLKKFLLI